MKNEIVPGIAAERPVLPYIKMIHEGRVLAVHASSPAGGTDLAVPSFGIGAAFMVAVQLAPMEADIWRNGRHLGRLASATGELQFFDLRNNWRALVHPPFDSINLRVSLALLAEAANLDVEALVFEPPSFAPGRVDTTMLGLARALVPAFSRPGELSALFVDRVLLAIATHLVQAYSGPDPAHTLARPKAGLAPWQQRRVAHMLLDQLDVDVSLAQLAADCGLSTGHFARAFRVSFGLPPHRWLLRERVRRAAHLLTTTDQPVDEIALACGFVDQSHLSRVFRRVMDMPPVSWRRSRRTDGGSIIDALSSG